MTPEDLAWLRRRAIISARMAHTEGVSFEEWERDLEPAERDAMGPKQIEAVRIWIWHQQRRPRA